MTPTPTTTDTIEKKIKGIVRHDYSIGGAFADDGRQGLCYTYGQLDEMESNLKSFITTLIESIEGEIGEDLEEALNALGMMYQQYCSQDGHLFMSAGENASSVLERWGMLNDDGTGRGEIKDVDPASILTKYKSGV